MDNSAVVVRKTPSTPHASEGMHWYDSFGQPAYTVKAKDGTDRPATLRDARKLQLLPSVTSIIRCAAAPGLELWKANQLMMSALTLPRRQDEAEEAWLSRVRADSKAQAQKAAEKGTAIHAALQGHFEGQPPSAEMFPYVQGVVQVIREDIGEHQWEPELSFSHGLGFGGKVDLSCKAWVLDFKTKEFDIDDAIDTYDEHAMQLAAYRKGLGYEQAKGAIVFVSTSNPGVANVVHVNDEKMRRGWEMFQGLLAYWQAKTQYRPTLGARKDPI